MELHKQPLQRCQNAVSCTRDAIFPSRFVSMIRWRGSRQHEIYGSKYDVDMIGNERSSQTQLVQFKFLMHPIFSMVTVTDNTIDRPLILMSNLLLTNVSACFHHSSVLLVFIWRIGSLWMDQPNRSIGQMLQISHLNNLIHNRKPVWCSSCNKHEDFSLQVDKEGT
jgi:hypothetical protein